MANREPVKPIAKPTPASSTRSHQAGSTDIGDIIDTVKQYAKQETLEPLKGVGRYVGFGVAGSLCLAIGLILLAVGGLRALQSQTGEHLTGSLTWIPYLIVVIVLAAVVGLVATRITKKRSLDG